MNIQPDLTDAPTFGPTKRTTNRQPKLYLCEVPGCNEPAHGNHKKGKVFSRFCKRHAQYEYTHGHPTIKSLNPTVQKPRGSRQNSAVWAYRAGATHFRAALKKGDRKALEVVEAVHRRLGVFEQVPTLSPYRKRGDLTQREQMVSIYRDAYNRVGQDWEKLATHIVALATYSELNPLCYSNEQLRFMLGKYLTAEYKLLHSRDYITKVDRQFIPSVHTHKALGDIVDQLGCLWVLPNRNALEGERVAAMYRSKRKEIANKSKPHGFMVSPRLASAAGRKGVRRRLGSEIQSVSLDGQVLT